MPNDMSIREEITATLKGDARVAHPAGIAVSIASGDGDPTRHRGQPPAASGRRRDRQVGVGGPRRRG